MKKSPEPASEAAMPADDLREEYDETVLKHGVRGKYAARFRAGTNLVLLAPDVAAAFPDDASVNEALRRLMRAADHSAATDRHSTEGVAGSGD